MNSQIAASPLVPLAVFLPLIGALLVIPLSRVSEKARAVAVVGVTATTAGIVLAMIPAVLGGTVYSALVLKMAPNIWMHFAADPLGMLFASTVAVLWALVAVYSQGYMADEHKQNRYYVFFMLSLGWTLGVAFAANLFTLLIFYELFSILTYPLVIHEETPEAIAAGTKYIIYILVGGSLLLPAIVLTYWLAGTQTLTEAGILSLRMNHIGLYTVLWCFVAGFGVKAALMPLHGWVPDAHPAAPAPFSALLSGVMVAAGSFGIARVFFNVFGPALLKALGVLDWIGYIAATTVVLAAILAISQDNLKRRLAYSTISQMAYVVLGLSLLGPLATQGALIHIANHAFMKGTLFLCAGIIIKKTGHHDISAMGGLASRMPLTAGALTVCVLGMIGTPPLSGFVSKWYLGLGMLQVQRPLYLVVLLGGALLAAVYLLPIVYTLYLKKAPEGEAAGSEDPEAAHVLTANPGPSRVREAPWSMLGPMLAGAVLVVVLGVLAWMPGLPLSFARLAAQTLLR